MRTAEQREAQVAAAGARRRANPEPGREATRRWRAANKASDAAKTMRRKAAKLQATPAWADPAEIATIYEAAALIGYEVDHIVPLISDKVCGLHCVANLRMLPPSENRAKGNRWWPDMFEENS